MLLAFSFSTTADQVLVEGQRLSEIVVYPQRSAPAKVSSVNTPIISAQVTAQIEAIQVRPGDRVAEGDVLVELDCRDYKLATDQNQANKELAEANVMLAKLNNSRAQEMLERNLGSTQNLDASTADFSAAAAALRSSELQLESAKLSQSKCQVTAPFKGLVAQRLASKGQLAAIGTPLISLVDLEEVEIIAEVYWEDISLLEQSEIFSFSAAGKLHSVVLDGIVDTIIGNTRNQEVRFKFIGQLPTVGTSGDIIWHDPRPHLKPSTLIEREHQYGFFYLDSGIAKFHALPNFQPGRLAIVPTPFLDKIILTSGHSNLVQGSPVRLDSTSH